MKSTKPENVQKLIDHLYHLGEKEGHDAPRFDMRYFMANSNCPGRPDALVMGDIVKSPRPNWCGTHACIAGHAVVLALREDREETIKLLGPNASRIKIAASDWLGIPDYGEGAFELFLTWDDENSIPEAIAKLKALL